MVAPRNKTRGRHGACLSSNVLTRCSFIPLAHAALTGCTFAGTSGRPPPAVAAVAPEAPPSPPKTAVDPRGGRSGVSNSKLRSATTPPPPSPPPRPPTVASPGRDFFLDETGAPQYLVRLLPCADSCCFFLAAAEPPAGARGVGLPRHAASAAAAASPKALSGAVAAA